ncbi:MerR family transcriptional regulator [Sporofaciens sp. SGI.106]|uniref:MerR family transcriptional regulator n=1 Tax=Sporofaciens sp. SGI.106 TaxID=3420568 RepID=UPI003D0723C3
MKEMKMRKKHLFCDEKDNTHFYKIGMFANMNRVTIKTLRYYDEQKLLVPVYVDEENGYRYYEAGQMADLHRIMALKSMGFSIDDIRKIMDGAEEKSLLLAKKQEILTEIAALTNKLAQVESYLAKDSVNLSAPVLIKEISEVIVCTMEQRIQSYDALFELMPEMGAKMEQLGCVCAQPEYCFTHYLEPGYKEEDILVEICQSVTEKKQDYEQLTFKVLPKVPKAACIFHKGSYNTLHKSYAMLLQYIEENGYEICGNIRESYIDGVWNKESEQEWLTEIQIPVQSF